MWVYFPFFTLCFSITLLILPNFFWYFFYFLKSGKGLESFLNLLRGEGIESISLFWEKKC